MRADVATGVGDRVADAVRDGVADQVILLRQLVAFRTENPALLTDDAARATAADEEAGCLALLGRELRTLGMSTDTWQVRPGGSDLVGRLGGTGAGRSLLLNGHVDVVPAGPEAAWPHPPWAADVEDGTVWGRGTVDMKGGLVAAIGAVRAVQRCGIRLGGDVLLAVVTDEEVGGGGTRSLLSRGYRADGAIVMEPTTGALCPVEGGLEWLDVVVPGQAGHSAQRYRSIHAGGRGASVNAIEKAVKLLGAISEYERHRANTAVHPLLPAGITTINPGVMLGGSGPAADGRPAGTRAYSNVPDTCVLGLSLKYLPNERIDDVRRAFEAHIAAVAATDPWLSAHPPRVVWGAGGVSMPPCDTPVDHPLVRAVAGASEAVTGHARLAGFEAKTDLTWIAAAGIPGVIYGPGAIDLAHGPGERLAIADLEDATRVLALTLVAWCGAA